MEDILLIIIIILLPLIADIIVRTTYRKNLKVHSKQKITGQEVARMILDKNGLQSIYVVETNGYLSDHYDPRRKVIRLSKAVYSGDSIASIAIAAHEVGHAIQDKDNYSFMKIRSLIFPVVNIATTMSYYIILISLIFQILDLLYLGIGFAFIGLLFQIITLPVEFNASNRAKEELKKIRIVNSEEELGIKKVLKAAAFTYVAGVLANVLQIVRLLLIANRD